MIVNKDISRKKKQIYDKLYSEGGDFKHFPRIDEAFAQVLIKKYDLRDACGLDLGCGTGWWTYLFKKNGVTCYGLDISNVGIQKGREKFGNLELIVGDALILPFKYKSFDFILCGGLSLFNVDDLQQLKEMGNEFLRYLKNGGLFFIMWASDLSNKRSPDAFMNHTLKNWEDYLSSLNCKIIGVYFTHRLFFSVLKGFVLNETLTAIFSKIFSIMPLRGKLRYIRGESIYVCKVEKV